MSEKIVLIDGHSILNRAFFGLPDLTNSQGLHTNAVYGFLNILFKILEEEKPNYLAVAFDVNINKNNYNGYVDGNINHFDFNNYRYNNITAKVNVDNNFIEGIANIDDPNINISIEGEANLDKNNPYINAHALANTINFNNINLTNKYHHLSAEIEANLNGLDIDNATGHINVNNLRYSNNPAKELFIDHIAINAHNEGVDKQSLSISSNFLNASINGSYSYKSLVPAVKDILSHSFPVFFGENAHQSAPSARE